ncbi:hypothetical protein BU24DRAFT_489041 [Aaosphaeria arxii CBS 175.79]|uniref:Uncharacterized protein n=1 Tax=Aaosphaeria arxii CBS 175.79 TaxID=1450172 RepID=A0A6A5Y1C2_9PLEO|nr:uncharacterized protein BU24DRAFT_489041 [Aaosphaeria arxii CBS 175.79]KAF2018993.1 hypothetical protein BU24DRAFT_489041 [Aaosphaeria arxii CBS 175.79]
MQPQHKHSRRRRTSETQGTQREISEYDAGKRESAGEQSESNQNRPYYNDHEARTDGEHSNTYDASKSSHKAYEWRAVTRSWGQAESNTSDTRSRNAPDYNYHHLSSNNQQAAHTYQEHHHQPKRHHPSLADLHQMNDNVALVGAIDSWLHEDKRQGPWDGVGHIKVKRKE